MYKILERAINGIATTTPSYCKLDIIDSELIDYGSLNEFHISFSVIK